MYAHNLFKPLNIFGHNFARDLESRLSIEDADRALCSVLKS